MLKLKLQYSGHLMWTADSLENSLMLGKIEGRKNRGHQRMRWLDGIIDAMDMNVGKLQEMVRDREAWHAAVHVVAKRLGPIPHRYMWATEQQWKDQMLVKSSKWASKVKLGEKKRSTVCPPWTSLVVQWLRPCTFNAGSTGSIPGWGTKIPNSVWCGQTKNKGIFLLSQRDAETKQEPTIYRMGSVIRAHISLPGLFQKFQGFLPYLWFSFLKAKQSTLKPFIYNVSALETVVSFVNYTNSSWRIFQQVLSLSSQKEHLLPKMITFLIPKVHILTALDTWYFQGPS